MFAPTRALFTFSSLIMLTITIPVRAEVYEINFNEGCGLDAESEITRDNAYCLEPALPLNNLEDKKQDLEILENVEDIDATEWDLQLLYENCIAGLEVDCQELQVEQRRRLERQPAVNSVTSEEPFEYNLDEY